MDAPSNLTRCSSSVPSPLKVPEMILNFTCMLSNITVTPDGFLDFGPAPFRVQPVQCLYGTSGVCAPALRVAFYVLCLLSLRFRKEDWISAVCMGLVMSYSSVAAIHAVILAAGRKILIAGHPEMVTVSSRGDIKIPIWPMSWDEDCDAVLAITGTAFLIMAPMIIWSDTVRGILQTNSQPDGGRKRNVLIGWFALLLAGVISAWINEFFADLYSVEQFRFCSAEGEVPDIGSSSSLILLGRQNADKSFNDTIWEIYSIPSISRGQLPTCVYPCFNAPGYRRKSNIEVIASKGTWPTTSDFNNTRAGWALMITSMILIGISFAAIVLLYILERTRCLNYGRGGRAHHVNNRGESPKVRWWLDYVAKGLTIGSFFLFVAWIEYTLWPFPYTEVFSDVGQWGQLTTIILLLAFAAYDGWDEVAAVLQRTGRSAIEIYRRMRRPTPRTSISLSPHFAEIILMPPSSSDGNAAPPAPPPLNEDPNQGPP